jgi:ankyrin repeat protein
MHEAIWAGRSEEAQALVRAPDADVNAKVWMRETRTTALHLAMMRHDEATVRALAEIPHLDVNALDGYGRTVLDVAAMNDAHQCIRALVSTRQDVDVSTRDPFYHVCSEETASALLTIQGIDVYIGAKRKMLDHSIFMTMLRALGTDINRTDNDGYTMLHHAVEKKFINAIIAVLKVPGVDVNARTNEGDTALHIAVRDFPEAVPLLNGLDKRIIGEVLYAFE